MTSNSKQLPLTLNLIHRCLTACLLVIISTNTFANNAERTPSENIVVTIKPLFSLVAHITKGINKPTLLFKNMQTPHHYNMRPSERRLLAKANSIIWLGPELEPQLKKIIAASATKTTAISAIKAKGLNLLSKRSKHSHEEAETTQSEHHEENTIDPHIWLSTHNAIQISKHITERLGKRYPQHEEQYKKNLQQLIEKIEQARTIVRLNLSKNKKSYIALHDAFQYFEKENKLSFIDAINYGDDTGTGLKHLREVINKINKQKVQCLVYQKPKPAIIDKILSQTEVKAVDLDPLGLNVTSNANAWFELMLQLSLKFNDCLAS